MKVEQLTEFGLPQEAIRVLERHGIRELYPPQAECVRRGLLDGKSMVVSIPTAAGKTLVAELCMLKSILTRGGKCLYVVPLRALANEKYEEFQEKYRDLGIKVGISTGDYDSADPRLARYDILIATSERVDSLLRHRAKWLADLTTVAVLDEVHLLDDPERGPTLEVLTARLRQVNPSLQLIALSATIRNSEEIADWLGAELVQSDWRPVPLKKGVYCEGKIRFDDETVRNVPAKGEPLLSLVLETIEEGGQVLVFVNTRRSAQSLASVLAERLSLVVPRRKELEEVASRVESALDEPTSTCRLLASCIRRGTAFHHAGLHAAQRREVERAFRQGLIYVVCATPTLAMGVNMPSRRVIIRDYRRYVVPYGMEYIPVLEFHQLCGRAGRPKYDEYGEAVLIARNEEEAEVLFEEFIRAPPERIFSKLGTEPALRSHVLAGIASGYSTSFEELLEFFSKTFFAYQRGHAEISPLLERIIDFLEREKMVQRLDGRLKATVFGEKVSALYIDPLSAVILRDGLRNITSTPSTLGLLHLVCHTPDMPPLNLGRDVDEYENTAHIHAEDFLIPFPDPYDEPEKYEYFLREVKTASMLLDWIEERGEEEIHQKYGIGAGDLRRFIETAEWLLYSAHEIARLFRVRKALTPLRELQTRVRYGVKGELLELVSLSGVGRVRARQLYNAGFRRLSDIRKATEAQLLSIPGIGAKLAREIKHQAELQFQKVR